jgi:hypothetical protein
LGLLLEAEEDLFLEDLEDEDEDDLDLDRLVFKIQRKIYLNSCTVIA